MKKILSVLLCGMMLSMSLPLSSLALDEVKDDSVKVERIMLPSKLAKKAPINKVLVSKDSVKVLPYNTLEVVFAEDFNGKTANVGDELVFIANEDIMTDFGNEVIPEGSRFVTVISNLEKPKAFNRSGKVYLDFQYVELPDGKQIPFNAKLFGNKDFLSRGKLNALGKGLGTTLAASGIGIGAGCGIGAAASAVIIGGFAIGLPIGFAIGATAGLITPGLAYKAKAGDKVNIQLTRELNIEAN